jgi:hypothetical protein
MNDYVRNKIILKFTTHSFLNSVVLHPLDKIQILETKILNYILYKSEVLIA